jgi:hypothetical protein
MLRAHPYANEVMLAAVPIIFILLNARLPSPFFEIWETANLACDAQAGKKTYNDFFLYR